MRKKLVSGLRLALALWLLIGSLPVQAAQEAVERVAPETVEAPSLRLENDGAQTAVAAPILEDGATLLERDQDGNWQVQSSQAGDHADEILSAVNYIQDHNVNLRLNRIVVHESSGAGSIERKGDVLHLNAVEARRLALEDQWVAALMGDYLRRGAPEKLRLTDGQASKLGYDSSVKLAKEKAVSAFSREWNRRMKGMLKGPVGLEIKAYSHDGRKALTADATHVTVWDASNGKVLKRFAHERTDAPAVAFSPDLGHVLIRGPDGTKAWNLEKEQFNSDYRHSWISEILRLPNLAWRQIGILSDTMAKILLPDGKYAGETIVWSAPEGSTEAEAQKQAAEAMAEMILHNPKNLPKIARYLAPSGDEEMRSGVSFIQTIWVHLGEAILNGGGKSSLVPIADQARSSRFEASFKERLPTLWRILDNPAKVARLLTALSFLRTVYAFNLANQAPDPSIAWAKQTGVEFALNEFKIVPVSESFRRHIFYTEDASGVHAVELKIPGEQEGRESVEPEHYTVPEDLWSHNRPTVYSVKALRYGQWSGNADMYGQRMKFDQDKPLGIMVFDYEDGKRLKNARFMLDKMAQKLGRSARDLVMEGASDAVAELIYLHDLGWKGNVDGDNDIHNENVRILFSGGGRLVGDSGSFVKSVQSVAERQLEMRRLLSENIVRTSLITQLFDFTFADLFQGVVDRLASKAADAAERAKIERKVREELGLNS